MTTSRTEAYTPKTHKLYESATHGVSLKEVQTFEQSIENHTWTCPFCTETKLVMPDTSDTTSWESAQAWMQTHLEQHRLHLLRNANREQLSKYEENIKENSRNVRIWVYGTMKDRGYNV